jgi:hypothetical protein
MAMSAAAQTLGVLMPRVLQTLADQHTIADR